MNTYRNNQVIMKSNFELLKDYLSKTSKEVLLKEWESTKDLDSGSPSVKEFLCWSETSYRVRNLKSPWSGKKINQKPNPEYNFGFFL